MCVGTKHTFVDCDSFWLSYICYVANIVLTVVGLRMSLLLCCPGHSLGLRSFIFPLLPYCSVYMLGGGHSFVAMVSPDLCGVISLISQGCGVPDE